MKRQGVRATAVCAVAVGFMLCWAHPARGMYHPQAGRWLQRDPAQYVDGPNLYQYVGGMPTATRDSVGAWGATEHGTLNDRGISAWYMALDPYLDGLPTGPCLAWITKTLRKGNLDVDTWEFGNYPLHYNRTYVKNETPAQQARNRAAADAAYGTRLNDKAKLFRDELAKGQNGCEAALLALGSRWHSRQDFFMHAILKNGVWNAWSVGGGGTPDTRGAFAPSSYSLNLLAPSEHPPLNAGEPVGAGTPEWTARYDSAAWDMEQESSDLWLWWGICDCWCNLK